MPYLLTLLFSLFCTPSFAAGMTDDPLLSMFKIDQLEVVDFDSNDLAWEAQGWIGRDLTKLWLKTEGERSNSELEEAEFQFLYSRAIAPYWDVQVGWRYDSQSEQDQNWLVAGVQGLAPYFFEADMALFVNESGLVGLRGQFEYELLFTQKLILSPEVELNIYSRDDRNLELGSGLSDLSVGLRLRYEITRQFAPYVGIEWSHLFGKTADWSHDDNNDIYGVVGVRAWF